MPVDFIIAGVQKGATTALWHFLRQHQDIYLSKPKELHFFDDESIEWANPPYDERYHCRFREARPGQRRGEATPIYTYWPAAAARMHAYMNACNPQLKLIISLRDPVARAYSHWRMERARGAESLPFAVAIRAGRSRFSGLHRTFSYVERGFYYEQMARILDLFPREQVMFLSSSALRNRFHQVLDEICAFLEAPPFEVRPRQETVHSWRTGSGDDIDRDDAAYLNDLFRDDLVRTEALIGLKIEREICVRHEANDVEAHP